eukprot:TRINITY_DN532_c0_g1_i1.p1 TRINITY_DN532_c0_g1~~TRINITY_DN532_c0_g1_i1.p1  ORF type:complete len:659 (+),score=228.24 TRINITY_DN532_c0_g1_i1:47-2023(+)
MHLFRAFSAGNRLVSGAPPSSRFTAPPRLHRGFHSNFSLLDKVIGIDLGTTNSCVAVLVDDKPTVLENDGKRTTPSVFAIDKKTKTRMLGQAAQRQMVVNSKNTFYATKRLIGRRYDDAETANFAKQVSYKICSGPSGDAWVEDESGKQYSPSQIASETLIKLKQVAEKSLGEQVTRAVVTVPAYFDNLQRQATEDAGRIAGLKIERIINEPTAAALAFGINQQEEDKTIVVYDLGGGTFDVSILNLGDGVFEVKSTSGDTFLGGEDFNDVIINYLVAQFKAKSGVDLSKDKVALQRVREAAENAKHDLSSRTEVEISLPYLTTDAKGNPKNLDVTLTRAKFEKLAEKLVEKSLIPCKKALQDADMDVADVTDVILVGGMTRMPLVREKVKSFFKKEPFKGVNPDEAVAIGAALQGALIKHSGLIPGSSNELVLLDVTPLNLGIELVDGSMAVIIPSQTSIPVKKTHTFTTAQSYTSTLETKVYQGNRPMAKDNRLLGSYTINGIAPAPAGVPQIDVSFHCSADGLIHASSTDRASKATQQVTIQMNGGLNDDEIEKMRLEAERNVESDKKAHESAQAFQSAQTTLSKLEEGLKSTKVSEEALATVTPKINEAKRMIQHKHANEVEKLNTLMAEVEEQCGKVLTEAYNASAQANKPEE